MNSYYYSIWAVGRGTWFSLAGYFQALVSHWFSGKPLRVNSYYYSIWNLRTQSQIQSDIYTQSEIQSNEILYSIWSIWNIFMRTLRNLFWWKILTFLAWYHWKFLMKVCSYIWYDYYTWIVHTIDKCYVTNYYLYIILEDLYYSQLDTWWSYIIIYIYWTYEKSDKLFYIIMMNNSLSVWNIHLEHLWIQLYWRQILLYWPQTIIPVHRSLKTIRLPVLQYTLYSSSWCMVVDFGGQGGGRRWVVKKELEYMV